MYGRRGGLHLLLYCTCISPFRPLFCSIPGSGYFFFILWLFMCLLCVCLFVCMFLCGVLCCGVALPLSLWIVAGMVVGWQDSRAVGDVDCNCGYVEGLEEAITGQGGSYLPRYPSTP